MSTNLVVVGDALLDVDVVGSATRLAPDGPAPVVDAEAEHPRAGGAALAASLAARHDAQVTLVTETAGDTACEQLRALLNDAGVRLCGIRVNGSTPVKKRVRVDGRSLVRLDTGGHEAVAGLNDAARRALRDADAVLVSDYGRGLASCLDLHRELRALPPRVPVVWDPHPRGGAPPPGVHVVCPNALEAAHLAGQGEQPGHDDVVTMAGVAAQLVRAWQARAVAVTRGCGGALLSYGQGMPLVLPAPAATAHDSCGAGDMFAAALAVGLGSGSTTSDAVQDAVEAASAFVAADGASGYSARSHRVAANGARSADVADVARLVESVRSAGGTVVATGGCFDLLHAGHVATLRAARQLGDCLVVCLNSDASVRRLKGDARPLVSQPDRQRVLEALACVDAVTVFDEDTPERVLDELRPHVWAKGGDYSGAEMPEMDVLKQWGGRAVALPYVPGRSTSGLVQRAARGPGFPSVSLEANEVW